MECPVDATRPVDVSRGPRLTLRGGNVELGAEVRLIDLHNLALAVFPRAILPTGAGKTAGLLPVWAQQDWGVVADRKLLPLDESS